MGKVRTGHSTSLDGFIAGPNDGPEAPMGEGGERLFTWSFGGDISIPAAWHGDGVQGRAAARRAPSPYNDRGIGDRKEDI